MMVSVFSQRKMAIKKSTIRNVVIENNVEIGSNCSIDRGTIGSTVIGEGTKIDNLIQIAHNVKIGKNNVIAQHKLVLLVLPLLEIGI